MKLYVDLTLLVAFCLFIGVKSFRVVSDTQGVFDGQVVPSPNFGELFGPSLCNITGTLMLKLDSLHSCYYDEEQFSVYKDKIVVMESLMNFNVGGCDFETRYDNYRRAGAMAIVCYEPKREVPGVSLFMVGWNHRQYEPYNMPFLTVGNLFEDMYDQLQLYNDSLVISSTCDDENEFDLSMRVLTPITCVLSAFILFYLAYVAWKLCIKISIEGQSSTQKGFIISQVYILKMEVVGCFLSGLLCLFGIIGISNHSWILGNDVITLEIKTMTMGGLFTGLKLFTVLCTSLLYKRLTDIIQALNTKAEEAKKSIFETDRNRIIFYFVVCIPPEYLLVIPDVTYSYALPPNVSASYFVMAQLITSCLLNKQISRVAKVMKQVTSTWVSGKANGGTRMKTLKFIERLTFWFRVYQLTVFIQCVIIAVFIPSGWVLTPLGLLFFAPTLIGLRILMSVATIYAMKKPNSPKSSENNGTNLSKVGPDEDSLAAVSDTMISSVNIDNLKGKVHKKHPQEIGLFDDSIYEEQADEE